MSRANHTADAAASVVEPFDEELTALPAPPRARRYVTMTVMALTVVASLALLGSLRADVAYFFAPSTAIDLGDVSGVQPAALSPNTFVRVTGTPMASRTVRYSKLLSGTTYAVFPLAGQRNVYVQVPLDDPDRARNLARREFSGRLTTFGDLGGRFSAVRGYLGDTMGVPVSSESFLILADQPPGAYGWSLLLAALCALFVLVNVILMLRWFRPLPTAERDEAVVG